MKCVIARRTGPRGGGLGNELLPWAKGWIASRELNAWLVGPSWGLNQRRYSRNFGTDRLDFIVEDALLHLPHLQFSEADYRATNEIDFGAAIAKWAIEKEIADRSSFLVAVEGMWGGYGAIHRARPFLWSRLLASREALHNVDRVLARLDRKKLFVAVHLRAGSGDFEHLAPGEDTRGRFNVTIPADWYMWVCEELVRKFEDRIQFWFFTDQVNQEFQETVRRFNPGQIQCAGLTECSDLLLMALADLRICSISSYSMAACFLSGGPYIWYEPQLTLRNGIYSLWGHEETQRANDSATKSSMKFASAMVPGGTLHLGTAMDVGDPLPDQMTTILENRLRAKDPRTNLLEFGCLLQSELRGTTSSRSAAARGVTV